MQAEDVKPKQRCDRGQTNPSGRIERHLKYKRLSSGGLRQYEYNLYRYQLGGRGKVFSKVIRPGKLIGVAQAIAAGHPAEKIAMWLTKEERGLLAKPRKN